MKKFLILFSVLNLFYTSHSSAQLGNKNMYLLANLNNHSTPYSAVEGYSANGREYAILGCYDGTSFVDITDVNNIHQVGFQLSTDPSSGNNLWREMKTFSHYAYIVSEVPGSGIQIVDLQYLPDSIHYVKKFLPAGYSSTHSISQSGPYIYVNGASSGQGVTCFDLTVNPETPVKRGSYNADYIHDCRIVNDTIYAANIYAGKVSIISAKNKDSLTLVKSFSNLPGSGPHNTALTPDRNYLLVTDEIGTAPFRLKIWNIEDLEDITYVTSWQPTGITSAIVHNVEVYGKYALVAHYSAGVRMIDISNPSSPVEVAWYDTYPSNNDQSYEGCWGSYMFPSGKIIASDRSTGLYVLKTYFKITSIMEGFYNSSTGKLNMRDSVRAYLRNTSPPYSIVDSSIAIMDSVSYTGSFNFSNSPAGNYYVILKHRNCLETWSKSGGYDFNPMTISEYNFTSSDASAFGNNLVEVNALPERFAMYSGDVNFDNVIDLSDIIDTYNDASAFMTGYTNTDLDGSRSVDLADIIIADNNAIKFAAVIRP